MRYIPCAICGSIRSKKILTSYDKHLRVDTTRFTLVRCADCDLAYLNPQPTMEELAKYYPPQYPPYQIHYDVLERNYLYNLLKKIKRLIYHHPGTATIQPVKKSIDTKTHLKVLDFGCGRGSFLLSLREEHPLWDLYGFDIGTNKKVQNIDSSIVISIDTPDSLPANFEKKSFDRIYMNDVLEHVNDPILILQNLVALLKPNGNIIIETPNIDSIKFKIFRSNFYSLEIPRHLYHFSPTTLTALCAKCGLSVENIKCVGSAKGTVRSLYYALRIRKEKIDPTLLFVIARLTKLFGEKRINDDSIIVQARKVS